jgi:hypothetical protein
VPLQVDQPAARPGARAPTRPSGTSGTPRASLMPATRTVAVPTTTRCIRWPGST